MLDDAMHISVIIFFILYCNVKTFFTILKTEIKM